MREAACVGIDPELFFPIGHTGPAVEDRAAAQRVCRSCPVARQCLSYALESGQVTGVWGGLTEEERARMRRGARRARR
ncbi:WhiB family transcriptional regulator [Streptomyces sp. NPDC023838]|uniref:WhiB family transcriptional regulator n=1 Tax=Streptomyces sp. NPDC023838 TaxID=3154325 RepID=UPI0033FDB7A3